MLEYVFRYTVEKGRHSEFMDWIRENDEKLRQHNRPGWTYLGTWVTVANFGTYTAESRWTLEGYEALGSSFGDPTAIELGAQLISMTDVVHHEANLLRSVATAQSLPGI